MPGTELVTVCLYMSFYFVPLHGMIFREQRDIVEQQCGTLQEIPSSVQHLVFMLSLGC
jgi:hypothetical protein